MPIRAYCTICSDFFDHSRDVAAIHCGHTFHYECLLQWFQTAPNKTCPQCRKQVSTRHIINRLFFDIGGEHDGAAADPESLQNEVDRLKAVISSKDRDCRDKQKVLDGLKETVERQRQELECARREIGEKEKLCAAMRKQMKFLEHQHNEVKVAKEEAQRLRVKMKTYESLDVVLQGQRAEVEAMISDMGVGQSAVEQLSIYCISLKKEYENLKGNLRSSSELCDKLRRELLTSNSKLQKATLEMNRTKEDIKAMQIDLTNADKEIISLKKNVEVLQKTLTTPTRTNEAISRLLFESPAPLELKPRLHQPPNCQEIDLNLTFDVPTPEPAERNKSHTSAPSKKIRLDPAGSSSARSENTFGSKEAGDMEPFLHNSLLFRKKTFGSMLEPHSKPGVVSTVKSESDTHCTTQQSPLAELRPLTMKAKRKKVSRPPMRKLPDRHTLDNFLE
uniref:RING-type domain-containing protein n=1 Tax=Denticeps clupeoides TaxID=299321 RepID=A0AAY4A438_9TELE